MLVISLSCKLSLTSNKKLDDLDRDSIRRPVRERGRGLGLGELKESKIKKGGWAGHWWHTHVFKS